MSTNGGPTPGCDCRLRSDCCCSRACSEESGIEVTGTVADVRQYLWNSAVSVAPLKTARGVQNKVLEALAAGLPAVLTTQVFEGLPVEAHRGCRVAGTAADFADETLAILDLPADARRAVANRADLHRCPGLTSLRRCSTSLPTRQLLRLRDPGVIAHAGQYTDFTHQHVSHVRNAGG